MTADRKSFITPETEIEIDEKGFKILAEELICELFVDFVNNKHQSTVVELKQ